LVRLRLVRPADEPCGGRLGRTVAGIALIAAGLARIGGPAAIAVALLGAVPLVGLFDLCIFSALFGGPLH